MRIKKKKMYIKIITDSTKHFSFIHLPHLLWVKKNSWYDQHYL